MMKIFAVTVFICLIATISGAPTQISDNNVGDIITVGVHAGIDINSEVDVTLINIIAALLNQNLAVIAPGNEPANQPNSDIHSQQPEQPRIPKITPEMIEKFKGYLANMH